MIDILQEGDTPLVIIMHSSAIIDKLQTCILCVHRLEGKSYLLEPSDHICRISRPYIFSYLHVCICMYILSVNEIFEYLYLGMLQFY